MALEEAMVDTVARDLLKLVTAMVVDTEDLVVMEDMDLEEATDDTVVKDLPKLVMAMVVVSEDTEDIMEVTMVDMDTEGKFCAQHPFDSPEPSSFIMLFFTEILLLSNQRRMKIIFSKCKIRKEI